MKVLILGSGVIGTSLAYYLTKAGHEVTVVDRQAGPGLETSYANAGEVSPGGMAAVLNREALQALPAAGRGTRCICAVCGQQPMEQTGSDAR